MPRWSMLVNTGYFWYSVLTRQHPFAMHAWCYMYLDAYKQYLCSFSFCSLARPQGIKQWCYYTPVFFPHNVIRLECSVLLLHHRMDQCMTMCTHPACTTHLCHCLPSLYSTYHAWHTVTCFYHQQNIPFKFFCVKKFSAIIRIFKHAMHWSRQSMVEQGTSNPFVLYTL